MNGTLDKLESDLKLAAREADDRCREYAISLASLPEGEIDSEDVRQRLAAEGWRFESLIDHVRAEKGRQAIQQQRESIEAMEAKRPALKAKLAAAKAEVEEAQKRHAREISDLVAKLEAARDEVSRNSRSIANGRQFITFSGLSVREPQLSF